MPEKMSAAEKMAKETAAYLHELHGKAVKPATIKTSEPIDFYELPATQNARGSAIRKPVTVDYYNGIGTLFLEEHSLEDILHYLVSCCSIEDVTILLEQLAFDTSNP